MRCWVDIAVAAAAILRIPGRPAPIGVRVFLRGSAARSAFVDALSRARFPLLSAAIRILLGAMAVVLCSAAFLFRTAAFWAAARDSLAALVVAAAAAATAG